MKATYGILMGSLLVLLAGCSQQVTQLHSQASATLEVTARYYEIAVGVAVKAKTQKQAAGLLAEQATPIEAWAHKLHGDSWVLKSSQLRPVYIYPQGQGRVLQSYEATKRFMLKGLDKDAYEVAMETLAGFGISDLALSRVYASDEQLVDAQALLLDKAFAKAKEKALHMAELANVCDLQVLDFKEYSQPAARPMMMARESAMADQSAHAKQSLQTRVEVNWQGQICS